MAKTHWKKLQNPDYLGAYSLDEGQDLILTIDYVRLEKVKGTDGKEEECIVLHFTEKQKPMIINATNAKTISKLYKTPYIEDWHGRKIQIHSEMVRAFGETVEALRIKPIIPKVEIPKQATPILCTDCHEPISGIGKMSAEQMAQYTQDKYSKPLCAKCATLAAEDKNKEDKQAKDITSKLDEIINSEDKQ